MDKNNQNKKVEIAESKKMALHYMETLAAVARESFLILDADLTVILANPIFYEVFKVTETQTEHKTLFSLGNGQWNIPQLKNLLHDILPKKKIIKDFEVSHNFPSIGLKVMQLNAQQVDSIQLIIIAIEDVTEKANLQTKIVEYSGNLETTISKRTKELASRVAELERLNKSMVGRELKMVELKKVISDLKKRFKNGNGNGHNHGESHNKNARK